jgi:Leucine Rich repeat
MTKRLPLLAACLLLAAVPLYANDADAAAAKAVEKRGGTVTRDDVDPTHPIVAVNLTAVPVTDAGLKDFAALNALKTLDLTLCIGVMAVGMKQVAALKGLETLNLGYSGITDKGVKRLAMLKGLRTLNLAGTKVSDRGLMELAALKDLRTLILARTPVTDDGVAALQKALPDCKNDR